MSSLTVKNDQISLALWLIPLSCTSFFVCFFLYIAVFALLQTAIKVDTLFSLFIWFLCTVEAFSCLWCPHHCCVFVLCRVLILSPSPAPSCSPSKGNATMTPSSFVTLSAGRGRLWHDLLNSPQIKAAARWRPVRRGQLSVETGLSPLHPLR